MRHSLAQIRQAAQQNPWTEPLLWFALGLMQFLQIITDSHPEPWVQITGWAWLVVGVGWLVMTWIQLRVPRWRSVLRWLPLWLMGVMLFALACQVFEFLRSVAG